MALFQCKLVYSALLGLDSTFPKLHKNVAKKINHATQQYLPDVSMSTMGIAESILSRNNIILTIPDSSKKVG